MKNFIFNNYDIYPDKIYCLNEKTLYFLYNNDMYYIYVTKAHEINVNIIKVYYDLIGEINLKNPKIKIKSIIKTKTGEFSCEKNNKIIILFKKESYDNVSDIITFINDYEYSGVLNLPIVDLKEKFEKEIDDMETVVADNFAENSLIHKSFNYYVGMAENAVQLLGEYSNSSEKCLGLNCTFFSLGSVVDFNIFNFFRANKYYNVAIDIKKKVFDHKLDFSDVDKVIINSSENDLLYLFALFLYPIEFFDILKMLFSGGEVSQNIKEKYNIILEKLIDNGDYYLKFLNYFRNKCTNFKKIELINWIIWVLCYNDYVMLDGK